MKMDQVVFASENQWAPEMPARPRSNRLRALFEPLLVHRRIVLEITKRKLGDWLALNTLDFRDLSSVRERALARYQRLPSRKTLHIWDNELCRAIDGKADEQTRSLLLAIMLDGFLRETIPNFGTYIEAITLVLGDHGWSPEFLAAAVVAVWRKKKYAPSICEFVDECEAAASGTAGARRVVTKMLALLDNAEDVLIATGDLPDASMP
jgi:hypothetical protein